MTIEAEQLVTLAAVARNGSLTAAAKERHRSQPAISAQLKRLTAEVGEQLYHRTRHGVQLTDAGERLLPYAESLVRALEGARRWSRGLRTGQVGEVLIAASMTVAVYVLPKVLAEFHERQRELELRLLTRNSLQALALLHQARADIALIEGPVPPLAPDFQSRALLVDEIVLAVRPDHPLAARGAVSPGDLVGLTIVQREEGSGTREVVELALGEMNLPSPGVKVALEATGIETVKEAILSGFGAAFISRLAIEREVGKGLLVALPIDGSGFFRSITLIHPAPELCSQAARRLLDFLAAPSAGQ